MNGKIYFQGIVLIKWLKEKLPGNHLFFLQRLYTSGLINKLRDNILGNCVFSSEIGMQATGVPPNVVLNYRMSSLEKNMTRVEVALSVLTMPF